MSGEYEALEVIAHTTQEIEAGEINGLAVKPWDQAVVGRWQERGVGKHAIVGAGAVILEDVPDYAVVVGNPARVVRYLSDKGNPPLPAPEGLAVSRP